MLMKDNKKNAVSMIVAKLKKPSGEEVAEKPMEDGAEQDSSIGLESAAEDIMSAVESKDPKMLISALKSFMEMCESEPSSEESPE